MAAASAGSWPMILFPAGLHLSVLMCKFPRVPCRHSRYWLRTTLWLFLCAISTAQAGWIAVPDSGKIRYSADGVEGESSLEEALRKLATNGRLQSLDGLTVHDLLRDETFQKELFAALEREAPGELKEALASAGNMHNPTMVQLRRPFASAVLATPTARRIDAALAHHGLRVSEASFEKLEIRKTAEGPRFSCGLWLAVEGIPKVADVEPANGVFFTYTGYMTTVLELKDGRFRYWFESDAKSQPEPDYPLSGAYSITKSTITLEHEQVYQKQWAFRTVNGIVTLWRPDAMDLTQDDLDLKHLKSFGAGSILVPTDKPAESVWKHRGPPSR